MACCARPRTRTVAATESAIRSAGLDSRRLEGARPRQALYLILSGGHADELRLSHNRATCLPERFDFHRPSDQLDSCHATCWVVLLSSALHHAWASSNPCSHFHRCLLLLWSTQSAWSYRTSRGLVSHISSFAVHALVSFLYLCADIVTSVPSGKRLRLFSRIVV